ncbi:glycosyltransferase family 4 protein [Barnesiella viscericola]|uniref:glycosyltransferase family 4 protein n=1 Tax=Barnesiella viscericola TaxID=397865 RepID=UPI0025A47245|nr:glycosyltransferase family 4 protein [Barnesiella viscericola]MDM8268477.1 glycosyltransferase family 4 protein [Barnesiella viscericola]
MKILFFSHGKRANGGAERCLLDLIKGIKQAHASWKIYAVFPGQDELWEMTRPYLSGYAFIRQPWWLVRPQKRGWRKRLLFGLQKQSAIRQTRNYLRAVAPDIAVTNTLATPIGAWAAREENIAHHWFIHEIPPLARNLVYLFNEQESLRQVDALSQKIIVPSQFVSEYYKHYFPSPGKIAVVYQSIDIVPPARPRVDQPFTIGMLANFEPNKGQHIAIEALREVVKEYPDTHLLLIGGNHSRYAQEIKESVIAYKLESNVSIVEHTIHPHDYLIQADVALVCSGFECFGRVIVEGLKCGLPVIVPDKPFGRELIREGYNGFLYNRDDARELARKIVLLRQQDLPTLKQNALNSVENRFSVHSFAEEFISIINPAKP